MTEEWLPVPFDDRYLVSSHGRVKGPLKLLKLLKKKCTDYYPSVWISGKYRFVHHLVASAFIGERPPGSFVLHKDDNRDNNHVTNLYYGTPTDNAQDRVTNGVYNYPSPQALTDIDKHFVRLLYKAGHSRKKIATMYNVSYSTIYRTTS